MSSAVTRPPLVEEVLSGTNRNLQLLAAEGILPLPQASLIEVQVHLADLDDEEISAKAEAALKGLDPLAVQGLLKGEAPPEVVSWFAKNSQSATLLETVMQRRDFSAEMACEIAATLSAEMQEILLLRQDLIVDHPQILEALELNPAISTYSTRKIAEYRTHLITAQPEPEPEPEELAAPPSGELALVDGEGDPLEEEDVQEAIAVVLDEVDQGGEKDLATGLSEAQIKMLPPPIRTKLARGASRQLRGILLKDANPTVAVSVLTASAITESEIEQATTSRQICEEVLMAISRRREWMRKYTVVQNLAKNPRTPIPVAMKCMTRLSVRDLGMLVKDRNISDAVRQQAKRLYNAKRV